MWHCIISCFRTSNKNWLKASAIPVKGTVIRLSIRVQLSHKAQHFTIKPFICLENCDWQPAMYYFYYHLCVYFWNISNDPKAGCFLHVLFYIKPVVGVCSSLDRPAMIHLHLCASITMSAPDHMGLPGDPVVWSMNNVSTVWGPCYMSLPLGCSCLLLTARKKKIKKMEAKLELGLLAMLGLKVL